jgi:hypothetical protein
MGARIGRAYNDAFVHNWEYYPLTQREIDFVVDNIMTIADHRLIKIITHGEDVVGSSSPFTTSLPRFNARGESCSRSVDRHSAGDAPHGHGRGQRHGHPA